MEEWVKRETHLQVLHPVFVLGFFARTLSCFGGDMFSRVSYSSAT